jgi:hypothetical protein
MLDYLRERGNVTRSEVLKRFEDDDEALVRGVLFDLCENGLVVQAKPGRPSYRAATEDEIGRLWQSQRGEGLEELLWVLLYHEGPLRVEELAERTRVPAAECERVLGRLVSSGRIDAVAGAYHASSFVMPLGSPAGFEAAVLDHYRAVVTTLAARLRQGPSATSPEDRIGGSTYSFDVWEGHPLETEAVETLGKLRSMIGDLRRRVREHNQENERPDVYDKVVLYFGQSVLREGPGSEGED